MVSFNCFKVEEVAVVVRAHSAWCRRPKELGKLSEAGQFSLLRLPRAFSCLWLVVRLKLLGRGLRLFQRLQCRCSASYSLLCRQAEFCAVSGFSPEKTRTTTVLLPDTVGLSLLQDVKQLEERPKDP